MPRKSTTKARRTKSATPGATRAKRASGGSRRAGSSGAARSKVTSDHEEIRRWAEARDGKPACVRGTGGRGDTGLLRIDFPGYSGGDSLQEIPWEEFFEKFDEQGLALLYQDRTAAGEPSNFNKLVRRGRRGVKRGSSSARAGGSSRSSGRSAGKSSSARGSSSSGRSSGRRSAASKRGGTSSARGGSSGGRGSAKGGKRSTSRK